MKQDLNNEVKIHEILTDVYIFIMIIIFPLIVDKTGFFHILECKWYSFVSIASTYVILNVLIFLYYLIFKRVKIYKSIKLSIVHYLALAFLLVNIISCFISPFFKNYDLFIGVGRGEGLIAMSLYCLSFFFVSLFSKFKRRYITYFTISSIFVSLICILQYIGFNPFNMFQKGIGIHNVSFMGTIGNVDFISAMYCLLLPVSFSTYIFLEDSSKYEKILCILSIIMGFFIIGIIDVQSGKVAFLGTLILIIPFIITNNKRLSRLLVMISAVLSAYWVNLIINPEYHYDMQKLIFNVQFNFIILLLIIISGVLIYLSFVIKNMKYDYSKNKDIIKKIYLIIIAIGVIGIIGIYLIKIPRGFLYEIHELLHGNFDDNFGTYRIFLWKRTIPLLSEFPLLGSGPDTFAIRFMARYTEDIASIGPLTINDTAANVYLTILINLGIIGFINYLSFIISQIIEGIKKINKYSAIFLITIICYVIQDCFNLSLVIVTPIFWILMALHNCSYNTKDNNKTKK